MNVDIFMCIYLVCEKGYRVNDTGDGCTICPRNTYSDTFGADSCTPCPGRNDTNHTPPALLQQQSAPGSTSRSDCGKKENDPVMSSKKCTLQK